MGNELPSTVGNYQVIAKLGEGGTASVYLAMAFGKARFRKLVVTKVLHPTLCCSPEFIESFLSEARLAAQLSHPNVVNTYEVGEDQGRPFIAMEYLEGQSYWSLLKKVGRASLPLEAHLEILIDTLAGLQYAHEFVDLNGRPLGMVHRDISPQNVFITYEGQVKLLDFGLAKASCAERHTDVGVLKGKIAYLAPEQANSGQIDRRTDLFAVGVMLWEALAGRRFSTGTLDVATIHQRISGAEPRIRAILPEVPPLLGDACDRALAVRPEERFATAAEMRGALLGVAEQRWQRGRVRALSTLMAEAFSDERTSIRSIVERYSRTADEQSDSRGLELQSATPVDGPDDAMDDVRIDIDASPPPVAPSRWKRAALAGGVLFALLAGASLASLARREKTSPPMPLPREVKAGGPTGPIELLVVTSPPEARAFIDGVAVHGNPVRVRVDRDDRPHTIRVEASGFFTYERKVSFDENLVIKASLSRAVEPALPPPPLATPRRSTRPGVIPKSTAPPPSPSSSSPPPSREAPTRHAVPVMEPSPGDDLRKGTPTSAPRRAIDEKDPYEP